MQRLTRFLIKPLGVLGWLFVLYAVWYWWDMRQLRQFCEEIRPGTPVGQLAQIAGRHGIDTRRLKGDGAAGQDGRHWTFYIPSTASVGSNVCAISHDKATVISATIEFD